MRFLRSLAGADGMIHKLPLRRRLDARPRHARARRPHVPRAVRAAQDAEPMNAPHAPQSRHAAAVPPRRIARHRERLRRARRSQRARRARARTSSRSASASPTFPTPRQRAGRGDRRRSAAASTATRRAPGIDELRAAAAKDLGARRGLDITPDDVVVGAGAKPFIAYTIASVTDYGVGRRGDLSGAGLPDLRIADPRQRRGAGADLPARSAPLRVRPGRARSEDHAQDAPPDPQHAAESDRRHPRPRGPRRDRRDPARAIRRSGCSPTRSTRASSTTASSTRSRRAPGMLERTIISDGASKTWAMTGWRIGYVANRDARAGVHALDHQHRVVRVADLAMGRGGGDHRAAGRRRRTCARASSSGATSSCAC